MLSTTVHHFQYLINNFVAPIVGRQLHLKTIHVKAFLRYILVQKFALQLKVYIVGTTFKP